MLQRDSNPFWQLFDGSPQLQNAYRVSDRFKHLEDFESLLWVHYTGELGLISWQQAELIFDEQRDRFTQAIEQLKPGDLSRFFPSELSIFIHWIRRSTRLADIRYTERVAEGLINIETVRLLANEVGRMTKAPSISLFSDVICFADDDEWLQVIRKDINPVRLLQAPIQQDEIVYSGYLGLLDHMGAVRDLLEYSKDESQGEHPALELARRMRSIHSWRLNLGDTEIKTRFLQITFRFVQQLNEDKELRRLSFNPESVLTRVQLLAANWLGVDNFSMTAPGRSGRAAA